MYIEKLCFQTKSDAYFVLAAAVLILPVQWVLAWLAAAFVHEAGHYIAIRVCGYRVYRIVVSCYGAMMETEPLEDREWICAAAGPLSALLLVLLTHWIPRIAICALTQSLFNILPIDSMDGGRVFSRILQLLLPQSIAERTALVVSHLTIIMLTILVIVLGIRYQLRLIPCLLFAGVIIRFLIIKFPCKDGLLRVQ